LISNAAELSSLHVYKRSGPHRSKKKLEFQNVVGSNTRFFPIQHRRSMEYHIRWVRSVNKQHLQALLESGAPRDSFKSGSRWSEACETVKAES